MKIKNSKNIEKNKKYQTHEKNQNIKNIKIQVGEGGLWKTADPLPEPCYPNPNTPKTRTIQPLATLYCYSVSLAFLPSQVFSTVSNDFSKPSLLQILCCTFLCGYCRNIMSQQKDVKLAIQELISVFVVSLNKIILLLPCLKV